MFRILFVDDEPEMKVDPLIDWLKEKEISFSYELKRSVNAALRYIDEHSSEINLIVTDLGLPIFDNGEGWTTLRGMLIVDQVVRKKLKIPVIINSTTEPPKEKLQKYTSSLTRESNIIKLDCGDKAVEEAIEFILQTNEDYLFSLQTN